MSTPLSTPVKQAKLAMASSKSPPLANEYKKLLGEQHQRLSIKHQQDLDLIDDIRSYVKARLGIERDYSSALNKLSKQHANHIAKKFTLLNQCDPPNEPTNVSSNNKRDENNNQNDLNSDSRLQKRLANNGLDEPEKPCSLYKVWSEHINRLQLTSKNRADQFEQLIMIVDKLKDIRSHKASIGKKCLDTHLKKIHEDILMSMVDVEKARKLYHEDESQAKKARENEERIKKKRSGLLTKFTDLQAKKEKTSAQREANDIQSTQARNDYIMALAAGNAHLQHYYQRDLNDFIHSIDDGVLDHCKIFMATLSECDINSLKDALTHAQYWSKMVNLTGSQKTNSIFLQCDQSQCLRNTSSLAFEACNNDPIHSISLEHNADYALQHEIDKWFTWFKKECRNLSQLMHQLDICQHALAEGKKGVELNGQTVEDLEPRIIDLKQQIRKSEAAKLKAQARLKVIKEGGMQIEEWSTVESEIRADMARAQEELAQSRVKEAANGDSSGDADHRPTTDQQRVNPTTGYMFDENPDQVHLQVSKDSDDSDAEGSVNHLASVSRSNSNLVQKQQNAMSGYSTLADPSLVWQDDYSSAWGSTQGNQNIVVTDAFGSEVVKSPTNIKLESQEQNCSYDLLGANKPSTTGQMGASMTVQSSSPLSAIVDGVQSSPSPYPGTAGEAYKSDYECDYNRMGHHARSTASSAEPHNLQQGIAQDPFGAPLPEADNERSGTLDDNFDERYEDTNSAYEMLNKQVVAIYSFDKTNEDDLAFNENEILKVIEFSDANWVKAINQSTGEEGFVPTSYIRIYEDQTKDDEFKPSESYATQQSGDGPSNQFSKDSDAEQLDEWGDGPQEESAPEVRQCRAIYDYQPETGTYEEDGLPHLALVQGEVMRIIDQGEDDGWWLVEKEGTNERGHVPSMLVEEVEPYADGEEGEEDVDDGEASIYSDRYDLDDSIKAMPTFEPPKFDAPIIVQSDSESKEENVNHKEDNLNVAEQAQSSKEKEGAKSGSSSLVPTAFVIIEPTPEVESRRFEDAPCRDNRSDPSDLSTEERKAQAQTVTSEQPPSDVSYSVINQDFVLDGPPRRPEQFRTDSVDGSAREQNNDLSSKTPDGNYEPLSEVDSVEMPAPPAVVIDSCIDIKRDMSLSIDEADTESERNIPNETDSNSTPTYVPPKEIRHTGNVDISPILRHRAEEFSKQIIAEALMMAPGTELGPSTSFCGDHSSEY